MKKSKSIWNFIDIILEMTIVIVLIVGLYFLAERLERYIYRYTIFPFVAVFLVFIMGILAGRGAERTKKNKPVGLISSYMNKARKKKNMFVFNEAPNTYSARNKEVIEEIKSGDIVHVKKYADDNITPDDFKDIYKVEIEDMVDDLIKKTDQDDKEDK